MGLDVLKWSATVVLVAGTFLNGLNIFPLGVILMLLGSILWTVVAWKWKETALIVNNAILIVAGIIGLTYNYLL